MTEEIIKECEFYLPLSENCNEILDSNGNEIYKCSRRQDCYYKQLKRLQETLKHTENGRKEKANKLKRIEEIVTHCIQGGFTDESIQEIFDICREYEEV